MADEIPEFDAPLFKKLASNDTGQARGHQGGMIIPKDLDHYFPALPAATKANPTVDRRLRAILVVPGKSQEIVDTRYQHQTWGATRRPERRITDNLAPLRNEAHPNDFLLIERGLDDRDLLRLTLIKSGTPEYKTFSARVGSRRWGVVNPGEIPVSDNEMVAAEKEQQKHETKPLDLFDNTAVAAETRVQKIARSKNFQKRVVEIYNRKCAVCGCGLIYPPKYYEIEAAHIVPRGQKGADDARNGLALCRSHHWAFDKGFFGIEPSFQIVISGKISPIKDNQTLSAFHGKKITSPTVTALSPAANALKWHFDNIFSKL